MVSPLAAVLPWPGRSFPAPSPGQACWARPPHGFGLCSLQRRAVEMGWWRAPDGRDDCHLPPHGAGLPVLPVGVGLNPPDAVRFRLANR